MPEGDEVAPGGVNGVTARTRLPAEPDLDDVIPLPKMIEAGLGRRSGGFPVFFNRLSDRAKAMCARCCVRAGLAT